MMLNKSNQRKWLSFETLAGFYKMEVPRSSLTKTKLTNNKHLLTSELNGVTVYYIRYIYVTKICNNSVFLFSFFYNLIFPDFGFQVKMKENQQFWYSVPKFLKRKLFSPYLQNSVNFPGIKYKHDIESNFKGFFKGFFTSIEYKFDPKRTSGHSVNMPTMTFCHR